MMELPTIDELDEYNFGIDDMDMQVNIVDSNNEPIALKDTELLNPFFTGLSGGSVMKVNNSDIYSNYKYMYVMCMKNNFTQSDQLFNMYNYVITHEDLQLFGASSVLIKTSLNLLKNYQYKKRSSIISKEILAMMYNSNVFDDTNIVLPLFELTIDKATINLLLYDKQFGVENLGDMFALTNIYNKKYKDNIIKQVRNYLSELKESQFWTHSRNCDINMNELFMNRDFVSKTTHSTTQVTTILPSNKVKEINKIAVQEKGKIDEYIHNMNKQQNVIDSENNKKTPYYMTDISKNKLNKTDITTLFDSITDENELYHLFNSLVVSKEYCHTVVNNKSVLCKMKPLFQKYAPLYKTLLGYAWISFFMEENIMKTKITKDHRFVFDINTANQLPVFPFTYDDLKQNPYMTILVDDKLINAQANTVSLYCINDLSGYGVCTLDEFKYRFNLLTTGTSTKSIFDGIDWKDFSISGSLMSACIQKKSPLFDKVSSAFVSTDDKLLTFFNHYYGESDIDMICNDDSIFGFCNKTEQLVNQIKKNISNYKDGDIDVEPIKSVSVMITHNFVNQIIDDLNDKFNTKYTADEMITNFKSPEIIDKIREYIHSIYYIVKNNLNYEVRKNKNINEYLTKFTKISSAEDISITLVQHDKLSIANDDSDAVVTLTIDDLQKMNKSKKLIATNNESNVSMIISECIRFKIKSPKMRRTIELFRSRDYDFFSTVGRFHLPCVRAYYNGDNVYLLPSCISAMMTGLNIDYKYFVGSRDPVDIINKYMMRGFGTLLNNVELDHTEKYNTTVTTFGGMFYYPPEESKLMFGPKELNNKIFSPLVYTQGLPDNAYDNPDVMYIKSLDDLKNYYKTKYGYDSTTSKLDMFKFKTILPNGSVSEYYNWLPIAYKDMMEMQ